MTATVSTGLDRILADLSLLRGRRFALLANQAAVTADLVPAWQALAAAGATPLRLFAPEHGLWGVAQDMEAVADEREPLLGVRIFSLYGSTAATLAPRPEQLEDLDAVVVDLPDIGTRYYTFAVTLAYVMSACERSGTEVIVLDRPNPIGGDAIEGGGVEERCRSFVSELPVPIRHGMTLGELALMLRALRHPGLTLSVLACEGWRRPQWHDQTGLPWVAPSPNMPTLLTASIYPGACLVEATNLSEGRGTTRPFQLIGAPWLDGDRLASRLNDAGLAGVRFQATRFRPAFQKHAGEVCHGIEWHVTDRDAMRPLEAGVRLLVEARALAPERFAWRREAYEFVEDVPAIDLLTGSADARAVIEGRARAEGLLRSWRAFSEAFAEERRPFLLYG